MAQTTNRGYDYRHKRLRRDWARQIARGEGSCARCGGWIAPDMAWDLGHNDFDRSIYNGPEHRRCNRATMSHRRPPKRKSRVW